MSTLFPTAIDTLANPTSASNLNEVGLEHHLQHANANDAIEALETRVGITNSVDPLSLTKRIAVLESITFVVETPTGAVDSLNMVYTLSGTPRGSVQVHIDNILYAPIGYTVTGTTLTLLAAPTAGQSIVTSYLK